jgi:hypothetical protein
MSSLIKTLNIFILKFLQYRQFSSMILVSLESRQKNIGVRDLLLYFLWKTGLYTNRQNGNLFRPRSLSFVVKGLYNYV